MLSILRKKKTMKLILWGLAIIIIPAFVLWGAGSLREGNSSPKYIGTIGEKKIPFKEFTRSFTEARVELFLSYFNRPETLKELQKNRPLLNRLAWNNLIIKYKAKNDGFSVSNEELINYITNFPLFTRGGKFDKRVYEYFLRNAFGMDMTPRTFEEYVRSCLIISQYKQNIVKDITVTDKELMDFYKADFEKASMNYAVLDKDIFYDDVSVSPGQIEEYYQKQKNNLRAPERIVLEYIKFPHSNDEEKKEALSSIRRAYELLKSNPRKMGPISEQLNLKVNETPPFARNELVPGIGNISEIGITAFTLRPGIDIVPIVDEDESGMSYIVRVKERIPSRIQRKEEAKDYIVNAIKEYEMYVLAYQEAQKIYDDAIKTKRLSLKTIAEKYNLPLGETDPVGRFDYITGVGESYVAVEAAFKLRVGEISGPIKVRKGYAFVQPVELIFIEKEKFESEKEAYRKKILTIKQVKAVEEWTKNAQQDTSLEVNLDQL
ncbi:MAG: peptidylprolyl isomerase [Candidatus Omnitrophica bacterium]|nr:peptidylprolyl isomerase [Candidatus Omnitrophota bacterium]